MFFLFHKKASLQTVILWLTLVYCWGYNLPPPLVIMMLHRKCYILLVIRWPCH